MGVAAGGTGSNLAEAHAAQHRERTEHPAAQLGHGLLVR